VSNEVKLKPWPSDDTEGVPVDDLIGPIREALEASYELERRSEVQDIPYDGYDVGTDAGVMSYGPEDTFRREMRNLLKRDALDVILTALFQLGYEQGQRALLQEQENLSSGRAFQDLLEHFDKTRFQND